MKLIGKRGKTLLFEKEDGTALVEHPKYGTIDTDQSVQSILARGYWQDPPRDIRKHLGPGDHPSGTSQLVHGRKFTGVPSASELRAINRQRLATDDTEYDPAIIENARQRFEFAMENSARLTADIVPTAREIGGDCWGLLERVKFEGSIRRKIAQIQRDEALSLEEAVADVTDLNRYTMELPNDVNYTPRVARALEALQAKGYELIKGKDFWGPGDGYDGLNLKFRSPIGTVFELQFHTPESIDLKIECHPIYDKARKLPVDDPEFVRLNDEMIKIWNRGRDHVPPGTEGLVDLHPKIQKVVHVGKRSTIVKTPYRYYRKGQTVYRVDPESRAHVWRGGQWVSAAIHPQLAAFGGSVDYDEVTPDEANRLMKGRS